LPSPARLSEPHGRMAVRRRPGFLRARRPKPLSDSRRRLPAPDVQPRVHPRAAFQLAGPFVPSWSPRRALDDWMARRPAWPPTAVDGSEDSLPALTGLGVHNRGRRRDHCCLTTRAVPWPSWLARKGKGAPLELLLRGGQPSWWAGTSATYRVDQALRAITATGWAVQKGLERREGLGALS